MSGFDKDHAPLNHLLARMHIQPKGRAHSAQLLCQAMCVERVWLGHHPPIHARFSFSIATTQVQKRLDFRLTCELDVPLGIWNGTRKRSWIVFVWVLGGRNS